MNLMDILKGLPTNPVVGYGELILFSDILIKCELYGQDNKDLIEAKLQQLENQGYISISYLDTDLIVGISLNR